MLEVRCVPTGGVPAREAVVLRREGSKAAPVATVAAVTMRGSVVASPVGSRRLAQRVRLLWISATGSVKVKLLLACCIGFTVVLIACRAFSASSWRHHLPVETSPMPKFSFGRTNEKVAQSDFKEMDVKISTDSLDPCRQVARVFYAKMLDVMVSGGGDAASGMGYTILINTWKRNNLLKKSVQHYASCSGVASIHIVWSEADPPSDSLLAFLKQTVDGKNIELTFDWNVEDSLNNRFKDIRELRSDAIFSIDDDVLFPCTSVEFAFSVWQSARATLVGFVPRMHWLYKSRGGQESYRYRGWWTVWWTGTYSMVLTKSAFFHRKYLDLYTNQMPSSIRDYITRNRNCEDIAMSFLVANVTDSPPIWVKGNVYEMGSTGISSFRGHNERRSRCLNDFTALYGRMPLVATTVKAVDARNSWFW